MHPDCKELLRVIESRIKLERLPNKTGQSGAQVRRFWEFLVVSVVSGKGKIKQKNPKNILLCQTRQNALTLRNLGLLITLHSKLIKRQLKNSQPVTRC